MRDTPKGIVDELREAARFEAFELKVTKEELSAWEAADYIERLAKALERIRAGEGDPVAIAREALDTRLWMESNETPRDGAK